MRNIYGNTYIYLSIIIKLYLYINNSSKNDCKASSSFAFKAIQRDHPFITLLLIFIITCSCFGFSLRIFERHYWETKQYKQQDWSYIWNSLWCIFVSITTVGYGDFYPKTHFGRAVLVLSNLVGVYFISMTMYFMTRESILNENEYKAYKLITRLKLREEIKELQANIVYHFLKMSILNKNLKKNELKTKDAENKEYNYHKRCVIILIDKVKIKLKLIKSFEFIPIKEQLFDVCERIDSDIKELSKDISYLENISVVMFNYLQSLIDTMITVQKNNYAIEKLCNIILYNNKIFNKLNNLNKYIPFFKKRIKSSKRTISNYLDDNLNLSTKFNNKISNINKLDSNFLSNDKILRDYNKHECKESNDIYNINDNKTLSSNNEINTFYKSDNTYRSNEDSINIKNNLNDNNNYDLINFFDVESKEISNHFSSILFKKNNNKSRYLKSNAYINQHTFEDTYL